MRKLLLILSLLTLILFSGCNSVVPLSFVALEVEYLNNSNGTLFYNGSIDIKGFYLNNGININEIIGDPTGFDRYRIETIGELSFNESNRVFSHSPALGQDNFYYYIDGVRFTKNETQQVTIGNSYGIHFIYYNESGDLVSSTIPWNIYDKKVFVAIVYWDSINQRGAIGEERHGMSMSWGTHNYLHNTINSIYVNGFTPVLDVDGAGNLDSNAEMQNITSGKFFDEDIENYNDAQTTYEKWYKIGSSGNWNWSSASSSLVLMGNTYPYFNEFNGSDWILSEISNNNYVLYHIFASNRVGTENKVIIIVGENEYISKAEAQENALIELNELTTSGLPSMEFIPIATAILEVKSSFTNSYNARVISTTDGGEFIDFRGNTNIGSSGSAGVTLHSNLLGLTSDDHKQYLLRTDFNGSWFELTNRSDLDVDKISFNTSFNETLDEGELGFDSDEGALTLGLAGGNVHLNIGQEILIPRRVYNDNAYDIKNGQVIYISGGSGNNAYISLAKADDEDTSANTIAVATEDISAGQFGWATSYGIVRGDTLQPIDTSAYSSGDLLYLSTTEVGNWTNIKTVAPNHLVVIGQVFRSHATEGSILVNIQNGWELNELHDVWYNASELVNGDIIVWNSSSSRFEAQTANISGGGSVARAYSLPNNTTISYNDNTNIESVFDSYDTYTINTSYTYNESTGFIQEAFIHDTEIGNKTINYIYSDGLLIGVTYN